MRPIQMVDLQLQHQKINQEIENAIAAVIHSGKFINGPEVAQFATNLASYLKVPHVITCANGTDALQIAMMALNLKPGDEVIIPAFTYVATAEVIALLGLVPVLVDVNPDDFLIDVGLIEAAINQKTKAIVPVHLFGQCANMDEILSIAKQHNLFVIEDTAQAIGAWYTFKDGTKLAAGTMGHIGCTSFFPSKNLGCMGDGGAIFTQDEKLAAKIKMIANHGQAVQYQHDIVGVNSRLDTLQAAILDVKLKTLSECEQARNKVAGWYDLGLANLTNLSIPKRVTQSSHVFHQYTLVCNNSNRDELRKFLAQKNIPTMVYYPIPLHTQKAYQTNASTIGSFPVTELLCKTVISLPISPELSQDQADYIIQNIHLFFNQNNA